MTKGFARARRWLLYLLGLAATVVATVVLVFAVQARLRLPDLRPWHRIVLREEFHAGSAASFADYRALEERLFAELRRRVLDDPDAADTQPLGRYNPRSVPARLALDTPYNRSYELVPADPKGAALLVHGLTDSPYSMRAIADALFAQGYYVLVLRMPGHGTLPSGLVGVSWRDWYEVVALAAKHAAARAPGKPFVAGGYSCGAAVVTLYTVRSLEDKALPRPERIWLVSPAIAISPFAVVTNVASALSFLPAFEKSSWLDVLPEYDPYKYNSFPVNAANQMRALTLELREALHDAAKAKHLGAMPPVTVFQSVIDSTVTASQVVGGLLGHLPARGHELVVFDVNRREMLVGLTSPASLEALEKLRAAPSLPFRITIVGNRPDGGAAIAALVRDAGATGTVEEDLPLEWPAGVFSLGHVALPFPPDDPVYGITPAPGDYPLGAVAARGESGALVVPLGQFARLRSNPFFEVIRSRIVEAAGAGEGAPTPSGGDGAPRSQDQ